MASSLPKVVFYYGWQKMLRHSWFGAELRQTLDPSQTSLLLKAVRKKLRRRTQLHGSMCAVGCISAVVASTAEVTVKKHQTYDAFSAKKIKDTASDAADTSFLYRQNLYTTPSTAAASTAGSRPNHKEKCANRWRISITEWKLPRNLSKLERVLLFASSLLPHQRKLVARSDGFASVGAR